MTIKQRIGITAVCIAICGFANIAAAATDVCSNDLPALSIDVVGSFEQEVSSFLSNKSITEIVSSALQDMSPLLQEESGTQIATEYVSLTTSKPMKSAIPLQMLVESQDEEVSWPADIEAVHRSCLDNITAPGGLSVIENVPVIVNHDTAQQLVTR